MTSGAIAGTSTTGSFEYGSVARVKRGLESRNEVPSSERVGMYGAPSVAASSASAIVKFEWSSTAIGRGIPFSAARR